MGSDDQLFDLARNSTCGRPHRNADSAVRPDCGRGIRRASGRLPLSLDARRSSLSDAAQSDDRDDGADARCERNCRAGLEARRKEFTHVQHYWTARFESARTPVARMGNLQCGATHGDGFPSRYRMAFGRPLNGPIAKRLTLQSTASCKGLPRLEQPRESLRRRSPAAVRSVGSVR